MKTLIETQNITLREISNLTDSERKLFESFNNQFKLKQQLSEKQNILLTKILKREFNISGTPYKEMFLYKEYFYSLDYNDDFLQDYRYIISAVELDVNETIKNKIAEQYRYGDYIKRFEFEKMVEVPASIKQLNNYANYYMFKYEKLIMKLKRARTIESKYKIIKAINTILSEEYADSLIQDVLERKYWK
jgi:hypothetical protein